jgi:hypothetical protein
MAHSPKLEVYQIILKPRRNEDKTFRNFFCEKFEIDPDETNTEIFFRYFGAFIRSVDTEDFIENSTKQKAFTAYDTELTTEGDTVTISINAEKKIIDGTVEGGKYGLTRNKSTLRNKQEREPIETQNVILDKFFFLIYTPFESKIGVLFLQSYSTETITDIFTDFLSSLFTHTPNFFKPTISKFVPDQLKEEFKNSSIVQRFSYSTRYMDRDIPGEAFNDEENQELIVKVEIVASKGIDKSRIRVWREKIEAGILYGKRLRDYTEKKGYLKNEANKKQAIFKLDTDFEIKPMIPLEDKINIVNGSPNFAELKDYCLTLLEDTIIPEVYRRNAVTER